MLLVQFSQIGLSIINCSRKLKELEGRQFFLSNSKVKIFQLSVG